MKPDDPDAKVNLLGSDDYHLGEGSGNDLILHRNMVHIGSMENGMYQIKRSFQFPLTANGQVSTSGQDDGSEGRSQQLSKDF